jgi:hypothetical protein
MESRATASSGGCFPVFRLELNAMPSAATVSFRPIRRTVMNRDRVVWYWIGSHREYDRLVGDWTFTWSPDTDYVSHGSLVTMRSPHRGVDHVGSFGGAAECAADPDELFIERDNLDLVDPQKPRQRDLNPSVPPSSPHHTRRHS